MVQDNLVQDLCRHIRYLLTLKARPPFRLAGLEMVAHLTDIQHCLEHLIAHHATPTLLSLQQALQPILHSLQATYCLLAEAASWLKNIADGAMSGGWEEFAGFLHRAPEMTHEVVFRAAGRLVGVGIFDVARDALSAVYFYFDPELAARSPGTWNVLWLVEEARRRSCRWLYLGYYVAGSPRMAYKAGFAPHELLGDDGRFRPGAVPSGVRIKP